jgi:hypothetical protein
MSLAYCLHCLERIDNCKCPECDGDCLPDVVYGETRVAYIRGYRDCKEGKDLDL